MAASHGELVPPTLALGILSSAPGSLSSALVSKRFAKRRQVQRSSWLTHASESGVVARFVIRCLGLDDAAKRHVLVENATAGDMLCAPVNASEGRQKGPVLALHFWLHYAHERWPEARFIGKADDDVYVHVPDVVSHLLAIPSPAADTAVYGAVMYHQLTTSADRYNFHSFASTAQHSRLRSRPGRLCDPRNSSGALCRGVKARGLRWCESSANDANQSSCSGPFPFACGPFYALGHRIVAALVDEKTASKPTTTTSSSTSLSKEIAWLHALPKAHERVLDDVWIGSVIWRLLGGSIPINLFTVKALGPLYLDSSNRFKGLPSVVIWHNRLKFVNRISLLHAFHVAQDGANHCRLPIRWKFVKAHCCGRANLIGKEPEGRYQQLPLATHAWPVWAAEPNMSACEARGLTAPIDLMKPRLWRGLGIRLNPRTTDLREQA